MADEAPATTTAAGRGSARRTAAPAGDALLRHHARTFHLAARLLPRPVRHDLATLYGFCRRVDDAVDEAPDAASGRTALARVLDARTDDPVILEFRALAKARGIPRGVVGALIDGIVSDLDPVAVADERELVRYAYRVAGTVGLMICAVLDVPARGHRHAVDLGIGMQLTNIARDVAEDAGRGRVYLPASWVPADDVRAAVQAVQADDPTSSPEAVQRTVDAVSRLLHRAGRHYRSADHGMADLPAAVRPGILAASRNYEAIGVLVARRGAASLRDRTRVPASGKTAGIVRAMVAAGRIATARGAARAPHEALLHRELDGLPCVLAEAGS
jgi:phytoene synthase